MQTLSDKLSTESVYLVRVNHNFLLGEPSSKAETHAPLQRTYSTFSSPLQSYSCRITKFKLYAQFKIPYYWIVDPMGKTMELYELVKGEYQLIAKKQGSERITPSLFPGLEFSLKELWV